MELLLLISRVGRVSGNVLTTPSIFHLTVVLCSTVKTVYGSYNACSCVFVVYIHVCVELELHSCN